MKTVFNLTFLFLFLFFPSHQVFATHLTELYLWKKDPNLYGDCGRCAQEYVLEGHQNRLDISDYSNFLQTGYYHMALYGPPGTTVTLFGGKNYDPNSGFLIITKHDQTPVSVKDLESFPPDQWITVDAKEHTEYNKNGAFKAYFHPKESFKSNITSVKWKKWWTSDDFIVDQAKDIKKSN